MQYGFYFDQSRCIGCNACTVSCKDWNAVNPGPVRWRNQENHETVRGVSVFENLTMSCNHCAEPACLPKCPYGAITKNRDNGIVTVSRSACQGALECIKACPYSAIKQADDIQEPTPDADWSIDHPVQKCTYCQRDRVSKGQSPVCVAACPVRALDWGDVEEIKRKYPSAVQLNETDFPYAYSNANASVTDTKPSFYITKRKTMVVSKLVNS